MIRERWKIEAEHHNTVFRGKRPGQVFVSEEFYRTRPYGMKKLLDRVGAVGGMRILDVGFGLGLYLLYFASKGAIVFALDISMENLHNLDAPRNVLSYSRPAKACLCEMPRSM